MLGRQSPRHVSDTTFERRPCLDRSCLTAFSCECHRSVLSTSHLFPPRSLSSAPSYIDFTRYPLPLSFSSFPSPFLSLSLFLSVSYSHFTAMPPPVPPSIESILQLSGISSQPSTATLTTLMDSGSPSGSPPPIPSPLPIDPNDNRPPGGTRRSGGTKTPRKVQWTDERDVVDSPRALDEHGLDVSTHFIPPSFQFFLP